MDPKINRGARKLTRISRVINKREKGRNHGALNLGAVRVDPFGDFTLWIDMLNVLCSN